MLFCFIFWFTIPSHNSCSFLFVTMDHSFFYFIHTFLQLDLLRDAAVYSLILNTELNTVYAWQSIQSTKLYPLKLKKLQETNFV